MVFDLEASWRSSTLCEAALPTAHRDGMGVTSLLGHLPAVWPLCPMIHWGHRHLDLEARKDRKWPWL